MWIVKTILAGIGLAVLMLGIVVLILPELAQRWRR
jgi:hypothetical protein